MSGQSSTSQNASRWDTLVFWISLLSSIAGIISFLVTDIPLATLVFGVVAAIGLVFWLHALIARRYGHQSMVPAASLTLLLVVSAFVSGAIIANRPALYTKLPVIGKVLQKDPKDTCSSDSLDLLGNGGFAGLWNSYEDVRFLLGCPVEREAQGAASEQIFEGGRLYWWSAPTPTEPIGPNRTIYVLRGNDNNGVWHHYHDPTAPGEPVDIGPLPGENNPPEFGFAWLLNTYPKLRMLLGKGTTGVLKFDQPDKHQFGAMMPFEGGRLFYSPATPNHGCRIYVLYYRNLRTGNNSQTAFDVPDGSYEIRPDPAC